MNQASSPSARPSAADSMRSLGLVVDGPVRWGQPVPSGAPGVFLVELPAGATEAPLDASAVRRWLERVPQLTLGGTRPTVQQFQRWMAGFWLPGEPVLYVGRSARAVGARIAAMYATRLGDARPYSGGHWLKTLAVLRDLRVWWAETTAHEEYEDALLGEIAARNAERAADGRPALPFANLAVPGGGAKTSGLANSLLTEPTAASGQAGPAKLVQQAAAARKAASGGPRQPRRHTPTTAPSARPTSEPTHLSREGLERLEAELRELRTTVRPQVIARVKAARELGDLRENADYEYARKEQSFVEGRIKTLEHMLRTARVIEQPADSVVVHLGSTVEVETDGDQATYVIVGSSEANPAEGRLSNVSPVGRALLGARAGDEVAVQLPGRAVAYRIIRVS